MKIIINALGLLMTLINLSTLQAQSITVDVAKSNISANSLKDFPIPAFKTIALGKIVRLTLGGQLREYYQYYNNENWGNMQPKLIDQNGFYLHRILFSTDLQIGKKINFFAEFNSSLTSSREGGNRPSLDYNEFDLSQLYLQATVLKYSNNNLKIRTGRQMYSFGSQRLLTTREGPNNRLSFNGATAIYQIKNSTLTTFIAHPVYNKFHVFDDSAVKSQTIWGTNFQFGEKSKWELFYYGYSNSNIKLAGNFGKDLRHSVGLYYNYTSKEWKLEVEPVLQFGKFNEQTIFTYGIFLNLQKNFSPKRTGITASLSLAAFSGDHKSIDKISNTYNPMYPKPPFGLIAPLGPVNLLICNPGIKISPNDDWQFSLSSGIFWRQSRSDGLYTPAAFPAIHQTYPADAPNTTLSKFIGSDYILDVNYKMTNYFSIGFQGAYFLAEDYLMQTGNGKNITYLSGILKLKF